LKVAATAFRNYSFSLVDPNEELKVESIGISEKVGPLYVKVTKRQK
jgi:hypothetical protein